MKRILYSINIGLVLFCIGVMAEDTPKPPAISDAQIIQYFKARAENAEAQAAALKTSVALQAVIADMQKVCALELDDKGIPKCAVPKPEAK